MRTARLKLKTAATYHVMSRVIEGRFIIGNDGKLSLSEVLRCKVRYFSDGGVIGSANFIKEILQEHKEYFCSQRRCGGAKPMKFSHWGDLCVAKELRKTILSFG